MAPAGGYSTWGEALEGFSVLGLPGFYLILLFRWPTHVAALSGKGMVVLAFFLTLLAPLGLVALWSGKPGDDAAKLRGSRD